SEADKKECRKIFTFSRAMRVFSNKASNIAELARDAYESAIDYGAHPNLKGVFGHVSINKNRPEGLRGFTQTCLYNSSDTETMRGILACLDFGLAIIGIIALSGPAATDKLQGELQVLIDAKEAA